MYATQYFDELRSIATRMDNLLPPHQGEREGLIERKASARYAVIEARPTDIVQAAHRESAWLFSGDVPPLHQGQGSRRAFVRNRTSLCTSMLDDGRDSSSKNAHARLPEGISLWHATDNARRIMLLARRDLDLFFSSADLEHTLPYAKDTERVFDLPCGQDLCFRDAMILIQEQAPYVCKICREYADLAAHIYGLKLDEFGVLGRIWIQRVHSQVGQPVSLLESQQARYDGGPVLIVCLGLPRTAHDVFPTLTQADHGTEHPIRIFVPEGVMMILDGDARFRYSHGFPGGQDGAPVFYTITIYMDCMGQTSITGYERETRTLIMNTPMRMEHIITTRSALQSQTNIHTTLHRDTLWRIVQAMRMRLRSAESHLIMKNYKQRMQQSSSELPVR